ncbi:MarR family winged helix-turn-helix transcriptional regulator [Umezawaea endophytica]|uniref:MarR family transcriptional regulator n=1 Tax=Umezawaea endophytica TaxID=1654476 RepID=A0A9X3A5R3_9PSEU|nr:MarR family transcriptional regulator [Umezawaea endophytica]MCS7483989.1 MarR family transcriptional regulator [Umezawaea endophytica]
MTGEAPRWLTAAQKKAWIAFSGVLIKLPYALDADMRGRTGFSHFEYLVLSVLSDQPDRTLSMSQLAALNNASLSRMSHVVTRLEKRGWVSRCPSSENGRVTRARLTDAGYEVLVEAAPGHVKTVQELVFDALTPEEQEQLATIALRVLGRLDPGGDWPPHEIRVVMDS